MKVALAPGIVGALNTGQQITWTRSDGTAENLTGATLSGRIQDKSTGIARAIAGTLTIVTATSGIFQWAYASADLVAGTYLVQFKATFTNYDLTFSYDWIVYAAI